MSKYLFVLLNDENSVDYSGEWIGAAYISAYLKKNNIAEVDFIATSQNDFVGVLTKCQETKPDFIGIPVLTFNYIAVKKLVALLKKEFPKTCIILGHREATKLKRTILEDIQADICMFGEGEITTAELIEAKKQNKDLSTVAGICYRNNDEIVQNVAREDIADLDSLPFPDRTIVAKGKYHNHVHYVISTRGCKGNCSFCDIASDLDRKKIIFSRSMDNILDEIEEILSFHKDAYIAFGDDSFEDGDMKKNKRYKDLYEGIIKRGLKFNFSFNARAESIKKDTIPYLLNLKKIGLDKIFIGIDSGNEEDLRLYRKRANLQDNENAIRLLQKANIPFDYGFIMFNPYTTIDKLKKNIDFIERNNIPIKSHVLSHRFVLYTGAPMLLHVKKDNLLIEDLFNKKEPFCYNFLNAKIQNIWEILHEFRDWPANRDTISMVEGFINSLDKNDLIDDFDDFKSAYEEYLKKSRNLFIEIFKYTINSIVNNKPISTHDIKNVFSVEIDNIKYLWEKTYKLNLLYGIKIERKRRLKDD